MGLEWTNVTHDEQITLGHIPPWFTISGSPVLAIALGSPGAENAVLERCQLYAKWSMTALADTSPVDPYEIMTCNTLLMGEVFAEGAPGTPNPIGGGVQRGVITAALTTRAAWSDQRTSSRVHRDCDTGGIVQSQGVRGPSDYGGGVPELRIGLYTLGCFDTSIFGVTDGQWSLWVRALWRV